MKDFTQWHRRKTNIENFRDIPEYTEGDFWWCSLGLNVGHEEDGKHQYFERPVLVLRKFNKHSCLVIPPSSRAHDHSFYFWYDAPKIKGSIILSQIRFISAKRLLRKISSMPFKDFNAVKDKFIWSILRRV